MNIGRLFGCKFMSALKQIQQATGKNKVEKNRMNFEE